MIDARSRPQHYFGTFKVWVDHCSRGGQAPNALVIYPGWILAHLLNIHVLLSLFNVYRSGWRLFFPWNRWRRNWLVGRYKPVQRHKVINLIRHWRAIIMWILNACELEREDRLNSICILLIYYFSIAEAWFTSEMKCWFSSHFRLTRTSARFVFSFLNLFQK